MTQVTSEIGRIIPPEPMAPASAKDAIVTLQIRCPICHEWWVFEFKTRVAKISDIPGAYKGSIQGNPCWRMESIRWGVHALCGACCAKRKATTLNVAGKLDKAWTDQDERDLWGRLKNQGDYAALLTVRKPGEPGEQLRDDQNVVFRNILPEGRIMISRARCKELKLMWGDI